MLRAIRDILTKREFSIFDIIKDNAISIGLAILIPFSMIYGIKVFMPEPVAPSRESVFKLEHELIKLKSEGKIKEALQVKEQLRKAEKELKEKNAEYVKDMERYVRYYLIIALIVGVMFSVAGAFLESEFLSIGLIMGALLSVMYSLFLGWRHYSDMLRFFIFLGVIITIILLELFLFWRPTRKLLRFGAGPT